MKILCLDTPIATALTRMGHEVWAITSSPGIIDVVKILESRNFKPDLLIQTETLHERAFLKGLENLNCLKVYWAFDSHLNIHWHKYYFRLFDVVFSPHLTFFSNMPDIWTPKKLFRLAKPAYDMPFKPHQDREHDLAFVGREVPETRLLRSRFLGLLRPLGLLQREGLTLREVLQLYADSKIVPNESIAFEVNFRICEAASAGACVLGPNVGEDQNCLYLPGKEFVSYEDGLDLLDKLNFLQSNPQSAEKIGLAAWVRTRNCHLPQHRALELMTRLEGASSTRSDPVGLLMALAQRGRHSRKITPRRLVSALEKPDNPEAMALSLRCLCEFYPGDEPEYKVLACLNNPALHSKEILFACMGYALQQKDLTLFNSFWILWHAQWPQGRLEQPVSLYQAALALAGLFQRNQRNFQPGLAFNPHDMIPECALEALQLARLLANGDKEWAKRQSLLCSKSKGLALPRQRALEVLKESGWRARLDYALACLQTYANKEGLAELEQSRQEATAAGDSELFEQILKKREEQLQAE